jgi:hypothetical protein
MTTFYHATTPKAAKVILTEGFRDGVGYYLTTELHTRVWLADSPLCVQEGATDDFVLKVETELPIEHFAPYAWVQKPVSAEEWDELGNDPADYAAYVEECARTAGCYREWLVPVDVINEQAKVTVYEKPTERA